MMLRKRWYVLATVLLCAQAYARDPKPGETGYIDIAPAQRSTIQSVAHYGSSPFAPPKADDVTFVVDAGAGLDTGCTFRSGGPLSFNIAVNRAFTADDVAALKKKGLISAKAVVRIPAYDIDFDGGGGVFC